MDSRSTPRRPSWRKMTISRCTSIPRRKLTPRRRKMLSSRTQFFEQYEIRSSSSKSQRYSSQVPASIWVTQGLHHSFKYNYCYILWLTKVTFIINSFTIDWHILIPGLVTSLSLFKVVIQPRISLNQTKLTCFKQSYFGNILILIVIGKVSYSKIQGKPSWRKLIKFGTFKTNWNCS